MADSGSNAFLSPPIVVAIVFGAVIIYFLNRPPNTTQPAHAHRPQPQQATEPSEVTDRMPFGKMTIQQISSYNGRKHKRILTSICGRIFDVTKGRNFYGYPDGAYNVFAGCDATYMFGVMSMNAHDRNKKDFDPTSDFLVTLNDWIERFSLKYAIVGKLDGFTDLCSQCWKPSDTETTDKNLKRLSLHELSQCAEKRWLSVCGIIFNLNSGRFLYNDFNTFGNDISVAICKNVWNDATYNKPISELQGNQQQLLRLAKCLELFGETYPFIGIVSPFKQSCIQIMINSNKSNVTANLLVYGYIRQREHINCVNAPCEILKMISDYVNSVVHINWKNDKWEIHVFGIESPDLF